MSASSTIDLPPPPRILRRRKGTWQIAAGRWFLRLFMLPHTIIGLGMLASALYLPLLIVFGTDAPGKIDDLTLSSHRGKISYNVRYSYVVNGVAHPNAFTVSEEEFAGLREGQPCPVRILPILPKTLPQPRGMREAWKAELGFLAIAAFWNGCLSVFIWITWIAPWRAKQLVKWGEPVPGTILSKHEIRGKGTSYKISYYFTAHISHAADGFEIYARSLSGSMDVSKSDYDAAYEGQPVTVLMSPARPSRSIVYEYSEYEAVP